MTARREREAMMRIVAPGFRPWQAVQTAFPSVTTRRWTPKKQLPGRLSRGIPHGRLEFRGTTAKSRRNPMRELLTLAFGPHSANLGDWLIRLLPYFLL
ncbi:MAG: hypothetical protein ACOVT5_05475, partial [Armatimonadaceae bacterium]